MTDFEKDFLAIARFAIEGQIENVCALARQRLHGLAKRRPDLTEMVSAVSNLLRSGKPVRKAESVPLPVDLDSRLELLKLETAPPMAFPPIWPASVKEELEAVIKEQSFETQLNAAGLSPTRSMLFVGPPGVGKTLAARWLALQTGRPLLTLDLAAVMSSFLGRTGNNIRTVLDFARNRSSLLLLDEFDAIAKRRDDVSEVGELKRLVTVLLQAIDDWPTNGLLLAATNHPELLDPAVWRRFDRIIHFPLPTTSEIHDLLRQLLEDGQGGDTISLLAGIFSGNSFSDICRSVESIKREAIVNGKSLAEGTIEYFGRFIRTAPKGTKLKLAAQLSNSGKSQRDVSQITGLSRDTIRKYISEKGPSESISE